MRMLALAAVPAALALFVACGSSDKTAGTANIPPGEYTPIPGSAPPGPATTPPPTPPPTASTAAPPATTPANTGPNATPIPIANAPAAAGLAALGKTEAPGMKPDGSAFAGQFSEGQTLEQQINIQAGKCYTVVGVGLGINELDIQLVVQPLPTLPPTVLAQDNTTGPQATLGGKGQCFKNALPVSGPGKVILKATKGAGIAAAQVFIK